MNSEINIPPYRSVAITLLLFLAWLIPWQNLRAAHPLEEWHQRGPLPTSRELQDIASGEGKLVVVSGDPGGRALMSLDGVNFETVPLSLPPGLAATRILHGSGKWLLIAGGRIFSKTLWQDAWIEGITVPHGFAEMRLLNGEFWAWNAGGFFPNPLAWRNSVLYSSSDGVAWTAVPLSASVTDRFEITDMTYAQGTYVLTNAGYPNPGGIFTSTDGAAWTGLSQIKNRHHSIAYGNGRFVAGGSGGRISISTDAVNWTPGQFPFIVAYLTNGQPGSSSPVYSEARELVFSNGKFVALAEGYDGYPLMAQSTDGTTWTAVTDADQDFQRTKAQKLRQIGDLTYLLGAGGNLWRTSLWLTARTQLLPLQDWDWSAVAASATRVVVAGEGGHVLWSDDAVTFHRATLPDAENVTDMVWMPELALFLAVGGNETAGKAWTSPDGVHWFCQTLVGFTGRATGVAWGGSQAMICGPGGRVVASTDGIRWTTRNSGTTENLTAIEWGGGRFAATGSGGIVIHSADGKAWTHYQLGPDHVIYSGLAFGNGLWIVPNGSELRLTTDFTTWWSNYGPGSEPNPLFAFGQFITSNQRYVLGSSDGSFWQSYVDGLGPATSYPTDMGYFRGARFGNRVIFVGQDGQIGVSGVWRNFFQEWRASKFTTAELAQPDISGPDGNPDMDEWSNLFEYAFDLNPKAREVVGASHPSTNQTENEGYFDGENFTGFTGTVAHYRHPWASNRPGVAIWPERSNDLVSWTRGGLLIDYPFTIGAGKLARDIRFPIRSALPEFIRLRGEIVEP